jgi:hypothetical protein
LAGIELCRFELILLAKNHKCPLLTDDTKLISIAETNFKILTFDLFDLLLNLKAAQLLTLDDILQIILDLEAKDNYKFSKSDVNLLKQRNNFSTKKNTPILS